jgi:predicted nuclease with TOPRIM domain
MIGEQLELIPLTPDEVAGRSKELAALVVEYRRVEQSGKQAAKDHKETLLQIRQDMERLAHSVAHEQEWRDPFGRAARELDA